MASVGSKNVTEMFFRGLKMNKLGIIFLKNLTHLIYAPKALNYFSTIVNRNLCFLDKRFPFSLSRENFLTFLFSLQ